MSFPESPINPRSLLSEAADQQKKKQQLPSWLHSRTLYHNLEGMLFMGITQGGASHLDNVVLTGDLFLIVGVDCRGLSSGDASSIPTGDFLYSHFGTEVFFLFLRSVPPLKSPPSGPDSQKQWPGPVQALHLAVSHALWHPHSSAVTEVLGDGQGCLPLLCGGGGSGLWVVF